MLREGIDLKYGARHLKRSIERFLVYPLSNLVATNQVETGDLVVVDYNEDDDKLTFSKKSGKMIVNDYEADEADTKPLKKSDAVGMPLAQAEAASEKG